MYRLLYLLRFYLTTVLVFLAAKVGFMLVCAGEHPLTAADAWQVISHGLTLDLSTALYFLILPFLLTAVSIWTRVPLLLYRGYYALIALAFAVAFVADASLYPFWGYKLDATCLQYLETPTEAMASVTTGYLVLRFVAVVLTALLIYAAYTLRVSRQQPQASKAAKTVFQDSKLPLRRRVTECLLYLALVPAIVIGIRGGLDMSTTNVGQVYFSQNQFLNHSAVNPVFSFLSSLESTASDLPEYDFFDQQECEQLLSDVFFTTSNGSDTLLRTQRPNVVIVLMESAGSIFLDAMPNLQQLAREGVAFTNCYGNSYRTDRGTVCTLSGYPSFPTFSVMKNPAKSRALPGIARSLRQQGYQTAYLYGGDINFTNMRSYLVATGFEQLTWRDDYTRQEQQSAQWGVRDDITFQTLADMMASTRQPFLIGYSTLSSHEPWDVPVSRYPDEILNAFSYLDDCIGQFVGRLRQTPLWDSLLIVLLPDHSMNYRHYDEQHPDRNRIPMVWAGGAVRQPRRIDVPCNQSDLAATLLGQMGIGHADYRFSRDVLSSDYIRPFAFHTFNNGFSMTDSTGFCVYDLNAQRLTVGNEEVQQQQVQLGKAVLQAQSAHLQQLGVAPSP